MKKLIFCLLIVLFLPVFAFAAETDFTFEQDLKWDMTQKEVLKAFKGAKVNDKSKESVTLTTSYHDFKTAHVICYFAGDKLAEVHYRLIYTNVVTNENVYYQDYQKVLAYLTERYGESSGKEDKWEIHDATLRPALEKEPGKAVSLGYLTIREYWEFDADNSFIEVRLYNAGKMKAEIELVYGKINL